jgi:hypothetical protein
MSDHFLMTLALAIGAVWSVLLIGAATRIRRKWFAMRPEGQSGAYPELLVRGCILVGLAPAASAIHYLASQGEAFWGGGVILLTGVALVIAHLLLKRRTPAEEHDQRTTFREKLVLAQFGGIVLVFALYGMRLSNQPLSRNTMAHALMAVAILLIIVNVVAHVAIRLYAKPEPPDERDLTIAGRGTRYAYYVLGFGVWGILVSETAPLFQPYVFCMLVGVLALAELVRLGSQILYYRLGT